MAERLVPAFRSGVDIGTEEQVSVFIHACATGDAAFTGVDRDNIVMFALIIAGYLLAWHAPKVMKWWE